MKLYVSAASNKEYYHGIPDFEVVKTRDGKFIVYNGEYFDYGKVEKELKKAFDKICEFNREWVASTGRKVDPSSFDWEHFASTNSGTIYQIISGMRPYLDDDEFDFSNATHIYGYLLYSTMTGIKIMFCCKNRTKLNRCANKIYDLIIGEGDYESYCESHGISIVDDENGDLLELDNAYVAEINGIQYLVDVIADDSSRF